MNSKLWLAVGFVAYIVTTAAPMPKCEASAGPPPVLNPKTYTSPYGEYKLEVDPSTMYGQGEGQYRFTRSGVVVWSAKHPFTLWDAAVTNDGLVAGYAYTYGWRGSAPKSSPDRRGSGDFHVVIFDALGKLRLNEVAARQWTRVMDAPAAPLAEGMFVDLENDRFVIRVDDSDRNRNIESWWVYRLSTGKRLDTLEPKSLMKDVPRGCFVTDARPVRGTPLTLVHWYMYAQKPGGRFTLIDLTGKPVWVLDLPQDYSIPNNEDAERRLGNYVREHGAILRSDQPNHFDIRLAADGKHVTFSVTQGNGWEVKEVDRQAFVPATASAPSTVEFPSIRLTSLGTITLKSPAPQTRPVRNVWRFDVDDRGRILFVRSEGQLPATLVLVEPDGRITREIPLRDVRGLPELAWLEGDRWIITVSRQEKKEKASAWWVDMNFPRLTAIGGFDCPPITDITGTRDGGFVTLTSDYQAYTINHELIAFDRDGKRRWQVGEDINDPGKLFSPKGIATTTDGTVAVSDVIAKRVQFFNRGNGQYLHTLDLNTIFGKKPNYPSSVSADVNGGIIVHDFNGSPPIWRLKADVPVLGSFEPRYEDGRTFPLRDGVKSATDGHLWASDGESLLRLRNDGVVDLVVGETPNPDELGEIAKLTVDNTGPIYAVSRRTGAVHVFDAEGRPVRICRPLPTDFRANEPPEQITIAGDGGVYIGHRDGRYLRFGPDGKRVSFEKLGLDEIHEEWQFQPGTQRRWVGGHFEAYLVDDAGKLLRTIQRRPNNMWLQEVERVAVAHDGSVAILAWDSRSIGANPEISLYSKNGDPIRTIALPSHDWIHGLAFNGQSVVASFGASLLTFSAADGSARKFTPPRGPRNQRASCIPFFSKEGKELWLFWSGTREIGRFRTP